MRNQKISWTEIRHTGPESWGEKYLSGMMLIPREPLANGGVIASEDSVNSGIKADVHDTPARMRVS